MKLTKKQKPNEEVVQIVDVELNDEQLDAAAGGIADRGDGNGCSGGTIFYDGGYPGRKGSPTNS